MPTCNDRGERRGCGAEIEWCQSAKSGKLIPLDVDPRPDGNIRKLASVDAKTGDRLVEYVKRTPGVDQLGDMLGAGELYVSHFATCPYAQDHRR